LLSLATCGARGIVASDDSSSSVERTHPADPRRTAEHQREAALKALLERRPAAELEEAQARSSLLKHSLAGRQYGLIDSVRSGLDGSEIDRLQIRKIDLQFELERFNPYTSAAAFARAAALRDELAKVESEQTASIAAHQRQAEDMVLAAVERGDLAAFRQIERQIAERPGAFSEAQRHAFAQAAPEAARRARVSNGRITQRP
jgi:hypothetical protein